ncbi:unnamed protein product [Paramecium sonneborni]|uniref:Uncharacterized protein n=1 Tax=Paramecium sonneborni TaxID=65129 RepID=A0A8S1NST0_9CILI|nr:unnamed protein product [Paramecium sonneborni]
MSQVNKDINIENIDEIIMDIISILFISILKPQKKQSILSEISELKQNIKSKEFINLQSLINPKIEIVVLIKNEFII